MSHMALSWEARMVDSLVALKRSGCRDFDYAWAQAVKANPPRGRDAAVTALFDEDGLPQVSLADAFCNYAEDAWHGRKPGLRAFSMDLVRELDHTTAAQRPGRIKAAA